MDSEKKSKKHILVVAQRVPFPPNKGEKLRTYYQIRWFVKQGYHITVAAPLTNSKDYQDLCDLRDQLNVDILWANLMPKPLRLFRGLLKGKALSEANFYSKKLQKALIKQSECTHIDAVLLTASSLYCYSKGLEVPTIMDFMDLDSEKWCKYAAKANWAMRWLYKRETKKISQLERQAVNECEACLLISEAEIKSMQAMHSNLKLSNVYALGNGIDTKAFYPAPKETHTNEKKGPVLLFVGVMDYLPNVEAVLWFTENVWPKLKSEQSNAQLIIAGMNPTPAIQALAKKTGVQVTGFVDEILPYFHQADFFIAPFQMACGVQNKILQAFACGLPTLSTKAGIEGIEACHSGVHYVPTNTAQEFLDAIQNLWTDSTKRSEIGQNAHTLIQEHYSWTAQLTSLQQIIQKLIPCENN